MTKSSIQDSFINSVLITEVEMASIKIKITAFTGKKYK